MARRAGQLPPPRNASELPLSVIQDALRRKGGDGAVTELALRDFFKLAWPIVEGRRPFYPNWHCDAVGDVLTAVSKQQIDKLVINLPPGMAKSLMTSVFWPAWMWGPFRKPETRWLCLSFGGDTLAPANRDAERCRELIVSPWYQRAWGTTFQLSDTQNAKAFFKNDKQGYRVSTGIEGQPSGQRADIILIDDPTKLDEDSLNAILRPAEVYERTLQSRAIDDGSAIVLIMQRLHPDDLAGYLLKQDGWIHMNLPMFYETETRCRVFLNGTLFFEDPRQVEGQPLHERMNTAIAKANVQRRSRPDIFDAQQQQRPTAKQGQVITRIDRYDALPNHLDEIIITVDCAFKAEEDNSFVVFQKWGRRFAEVFLLDQIREHMELPATIDALELFCARPPMATATYVEAKANGIGVVQSLRNKIAGLMTTDDDVDVLKPFCAGSKEAKVQSVSPYFRAGNVKIPSSDFLRRHGLTDWTPEYVDELSKFPKTRFNDQADATAMAVWRLLYTFETHISAASVMGEDPENVGLVAGVFDTAYGGDHGGMAGLSHGAFGSSGTGLMETIRGAFGS